MYRIVQTTVFLPALIAITLCLGCQAFANIPGASEVASSSQDVPHADAASKSAPELYIRALETFDVTNPSNLGRCCSTLTSAIQALLKDTDANRWDHLTAPLFAFANARRDLFPEAQYRLNFYLKYLPRIDIMLRRNDGTVFVFSWNLQRLCRAINTIERRQGSGLYYRPLIGEVKHTVFVGLFFDKTETGRFGRIKGVNAKFLVDTFDPSKELNINVTVQSS